jgi:threonine dehydratase
MLKMSGTSPDWKDRILAAHERIRSIVLETPVVSSSHPSRYISPLVKFKLENQQRTGSFKFRGAANSLSLLTAEQRRAGVLTSSTGNHGLAVATAAKTLGIRAEIYVSPQVSAPKLDAIRNCGAEVRVVGSNPLDAELTARATARETGRMYISPYNDPNVIAGQGTVAVELNRQLPRIDAVFVAVGGGGLIGGIGAYLKAVSPHTQIIGCWPENSPALCESLKQGRIVEVPERPTLSESTAGGVESGAITFELGQQVIDRTILVSEAEILGAMRLLRDHEGWVVEGAAGVAFAAFLKHAEEFTDRTAVIILCGGNLSPGVLQQLQ